MENTNGFGNNRLISLPGAAFLCLRQHMVSVNNRRMTFERAEILLSLMQWIVEYLVALKYFDYSCSLGYLNGQLRQEVNYAMLTK